MYLYRALNCQDDTNYKNDKKIVASKNGIPGSSQEMLNDVAHHIKNASDKGQKDCWISTGKDIRIIITEYAIPQGGGYNTGNGRKYVAVIDLDYWSKSKAEKSDCYTIFLNGRKPICDFVTIKDKNIADKKNKIKSIKNALSNVWVTDKNNIRALFDCSQSGATIKSGEFNKMSIKCFSHSKRGYALDLFDFGLTAVQNGIARKAQEVLCYNEIPKEAIVTILSPIQEDIIYLLDESAQNSFIEALKSGAQIYWDNVNHKAVINISGKSAEVQGEEWMYPNMVYEEVYKQCNDNSYLDLEKTYKAYLEKKREFLNKVLEILELSVGMNILPEEEGLWVYDFDNSTGCIERNKDQLYDLAILKFEGNLYSIRNINTNNGARSCKTIGEISKKTDGIIRKLIERKKLYCGELDKN